MVLAGSLLVVNIGNTILNLALPSIRDDLDASSTSSSRHSTATAGLRRAAAGRGQPRRPVRTSPDPVRGLATLGLGSVLAAIAPGTTELIAARALIGSTRRRSCPRRSPSSPTSSPGTSARRRSPSGRRARLGAALGPITGGWLIEDTDWSILEPRRRSEQALFAVVQQAYVCGVSTRRVDQLVESLGLRISKSEVSRVCGALAEHVEASRTRPLEDR